LDIYKIIVLDYLLFICNIVVTKGIIMQNYKSKTLKEFKKRFNKGQEKQIKEEVKYYDSLFKFRENREAKGLTQEKLASMANVNRTTLSKIETGERNARVDTLVRLAQAMDMSLELRLY